MLIQIINQKAWDSWNAHYEILHRQVLSNREAVPYETKSIVMSLPGYES